MSVNAASITILDRSNGRQHSMIFINAHISCFLPKTA